SRSSADPAGRAFRAGRGPYRKPGRHDTGKYRLNRPESGSTAVFRGRRGGPARCRPATGARECATARLSRMTRADKDRPVVLSKIYTRTGDDGTTGLGDGSRTRKTDPRIAAYADVEEANAAIGVALALGDLPEPVAEVLRRVQNELFDVRSEEHTSELQSREKLVCRLLLEKKNKLSIQSKQVAVLHDSQSILCL